MTNLAPRPREPSWGWKGPRSSPRPKSLELEPGVASRLILNLAADSGELRATLGKDDLAIDNAVVLISPRAGRCACKLRWPTRAKGRRICERCSSRAFEACGQAILVDGRADLVVTDQASPRRRMPGNFRFSADLTRSVTKDPSSWTAGIRSRRGFRSTPLFGRPRRRPARRHAGGDGRKPRARGR